MLHTTTGENTTVVHRNVKLNGDGLGLRKLDMENKFAATNLHNPVLVSVPCA